MAQNVRRYLSSDPVFEHLERHMDDLVQRLFRRPTPAPYQKAWAPRTDVYETEEDFVAVVELAGVDPSSVTIEIEGEVVAISGQRPSTTPPACADYLQLEIPFGEFERVLMLPSAVDAARATANFEGGLLTVHLPKSNQGPRRVQVEIQQVE